MAGEESQAFEQLEVGQTAKVLTIGPISCTDIVRYQGACGDMNPVHHDEPFSTGAGFPAPLGVGMYPAGVMHAWLGAWLGPERVRSCRTRWKAAYFPGDTLTFTGAISEIDTEARTVSVTASCARDDGTVTMQGWMTFAFE